MRQEDFYFAGVIEGDGSLYVQRDVRDYGTYLYPKVQLRMIEKCIVERFAGWVNKIQPPAGKSERPVRITIRAPAEKHHATQFAANVMGRRAEILMRKLYPIWFSHRQDQVKASFEKCGLTIPAAMPKKYSEKEYLSWLAGLLDAEGCFTTHKERNGKRHARFQLGMTDKDIMSFVASWLDVTFPPIKMGGVEKHVRVCGPYNYGERKPVFSIGLSGRRSIALMRKLRPYMLHSKKLETINALIRGR